MRENIGGDRGYLALANMRFQSEFLRSNFSIQMVRRVGVEKITEKMVKEWMEARGERWGLYKYLTSAPRSRAPSSSGHVGSHVEADDTLAASSAPWAVAPTPGSRNGKHFTGGLFVNFFCAKGQKAKKAARSFAGC